MKRTQIQLDEAMYHLAKNRAYSEGRSMSALIRDAVAEYLVEPKGSKRKLTISDFSFIGSGRSKPTDPRPLSVRHDEALAEDYLH